MNIVDGIIILFLIATVVRGYEVGLMQQAGSLVGLALGVSAGVILASVLQTNSIITLCLFVGCLIAGVAAGEYGSMLLKGKLHGRQLLARVDRIGGAFIGSISCLLLVWFGSAMLGGLPAGELQRGIRDSRIIAKLDESLPPITDAATSLNALLAEIEIPGIETGSLSSGNGLGDVPLPSLTSFATVSEEASNAVLRVDGRSCKGLATGSGFAVSRHIVVTNAHVVAGMTRPYVKAADGSRIRASIIGFDPALDIAVLRTDTTLTTSLSMLDGIAQDHSQAIVLGYPGGGNLTVVPAAILERFTALGTDIYGDGSTSRDVYALKAAVREGNSGGPLVNADGQVVGVIFARSTTDDSLGYAVTTPAVITVVAAAEAQPSAGDSARCS